MGMGGFAALWCAWGAALCWYDWRYRRLPNWLTLPAAVASLCALTAPGLAWPAVYAVLGLRGGIGGGDIKLSVPLGVAAAHVAGLRGVLLAMAIASLWTLGHAAILRARGSRLPPAHGPGMLCGASVAMALGYLFGG